MVDGNTSLLRQERPLAALGCPPTDRLVSLAKNPFKNSPAFATNESPGAAPAHLCDGFRKMNSTPLCDYCLEATFGS